jgi:hypothetical protein
VKKSEAAMTSDFSVDAQFLPDEFTHHFYGLT